MWQARQFHPHISLSKKRLPISIFTFKGSVRFYSTGNPDVKKASEGLLKQLKNNAELKKKLQQLEYVPKPELKHPTAAQGPALVFQLNSTRPKILFVNAIFSFAAFPVHFWGFYLGLDPYLLVFPFSFSVMWLFYTLRKNPRTVKRIAMLDSKTVSITSFNFFGGEKSQIVSRPSITPVIDIAPQDRERYNQFDVMVGEGRKKKQEGKEQKKKRNRKNTIFFQGQQRKKSRFLLERKKGEILDHDLFTKIFGYDS